MTIIAALKHEDEIWMMSDRLLTWGYTGRSDLPEFSKIVRFKNAFIGQSGTGVYGTALSYLAEREPKRYKSAFDTRWDVLDFFIHYRTFMQEKFVLGHAKENDVPQMNASFLVVTADKIFEVAGNRDVTEYDNFTAIGCGSEYAVGAMDALYGVLNCPQEILQRAYQTCCKHNIGCGGEIEIINVTRALRKKPGRKSTKPAKDADKTMTFVTMNNTPSSQTVS